MSFNPNKAVPPTVREVSTKLSTISLSLQGHTTKDFFPFGERIKLLIICIAAVTSVLLISKMDSRPSIITIRSSYLLSVNLFISLRISISFEIVNISTFSINKSSVLKKVVFPLPELPKRIKKEPLPLLYISS